jgi:hypothetical protein
MADAAALLAAVDALPPGARGAFVVADAAGRQLGALLADGNRVCWAAVAGHGRRLRDLLHLSGSAGAPDVTSAEVRAAIRQHTIESLIHLDGGDGSAYWVAHKDGGYRPRWTFGTAELLAAVGAELYAAESAGADALDALLPSGTAGASFAIGDDGEPVLVRERAGDTLGLRALEELGEWAAAALEVTRGFSAAAMAQALAAARGRGALAWRGGRRLVHALVINDPSALARAVAELERRGHPAVLSARAPRAS